MAERSIAILGPGLLGGSIALAARKRLPEAELRLWARRAEAVKTVQERGLADVASIDVKEVVRGASIIVLCVPVPVMKDLALSFADDVSDNAVVTDVGSVKQPVVGLMAEVFGTKPFSFVGSHPMAGSEQTGLDAASADLFEDATCIVTPTSETRAEALMRVQDFWSELGGRVLSMDAREHDRKVARVSHLPHAVAFSLVKAALQGDPSAAACAGKGFRDTTRIAGSDPDLWADIFLENRSEVVAALEDAIACTQELLAFVRGADKEPLRQFIADAQQLKRSARRTH